MPGIKHGRRGGPEPGRYIIDQPARDVATDVGTRVPSYRHAQKEAMQRGDASTYFMRKTIKASRKRGSKQ